MTARKLTPVGPASPSTGDVELLVAYCARPKCRKRIERPAGPGRPKDYCSDECRLTARDEQRVLRSRLAHYESVIDQIRTDIAAFGRSAGDGESTESPDSVAQRAVNALLRAEGALRYAPDTDPVTEDLRALAEAVAPLLRTALDRAS